MSEFTLRSKTTMFSIESAPPEIQGGRGERTISRWSFLKNEDVEIVSDRTYTGSVHSLYASQAYRPTTVHLEKEGAW